MNDRGADGFVATDWGSSARRCYRLNSTGQVIDEFEDEAGVLKIAPGGFPGAIAQLRTRFGDLQLLMAGMVGSNRGWVEAGYVRCPATLDDVAAGLKWIEPGRTAIVPGLSLVDGDRADVMRGEEVQIFGAHELEPPVGRQVLCLPGTHTKWVESEGGTVLGFRTVMTGELFALLRDHSILADLLTAPATIDPAFLQGVERGYAGADLGAELFQVRARAVLRNGIEAPASFVSGLLIGSDLRAGLGSVVSGSEIIVIGRGSLTSLYAAAIGQCGFVPREIDGGAAFVAGMRAIRERIS